MQILDGKKIAQEMKEDLKNQVSCSFPEKKYVAIIFLWENKSSQTYVNLKKKFGNDIGLDVHVFWQKSIQEEHPNNDRDYQLEYFQKKEYRNVSELAELIEYLNFDKDCVGIMIQLPLPENFKKYQARILSMISPKKDIDGLWGKLQGLSSIWAIDFLPATPKSVITLLEKYDLVDFQWKTISILGQSDLIGKPLAIECMKKWATVFSFNERSNQDIMKETSKKSDYIISCTGQIHLVDDSFLNESGNQILVDVGYGYKDGKPVGDINFQKVENKVQATSPVPGGVWPLTVACLFDNIFVLKKNLGRI